MGCKGLKKDGSGPCQMRPAAGQDFCINHGGTKAEKPPPADAGGSTTSEAPKKIAPKAVPASPAARSGGGVGIVVGVVVGLALAGSAVFVARRYLRPALPKPRPLMAVG